MSLSALADETRPEPRLERTKSVTSWTWECRHCKKACVNVNSQSQCICGHRLCYHGAGGKESDFRCKKCPCKKFFFIMSEGSWVLRCRCKHKHTEHDPNTRKCKKASCKCTCFESPWVCNCNHPWAEHDHKLITREVKIFGSGCEMEAANLQIATKDINNYDNLKRGMEHNATPL
eukprot:jgi/Ulvmu1/7656/UM038_0085.1